MLAQYIAATIPTENGVNPLLEQASQIGSPPDQTRQPTETKTADPEVGPQIDPPAGSLERFFGSFGSPGRWAGRG